ncbi:MAG: hypothetical protein JO249_23070 [Acidobacteria bacterium]|nr:hypothetical protein [Acidobacteriota bacterium]
MIRSSALGSSSVLACALNRLRQSIGAEYPNTERELETIAQATYGVPIFSTATPEQVGSAYHAACELGQ